MLPSLLRLQPRDPTTAAPLDPETIFSAALGTIFTDDVRNQHGDPENVIVYSSVYGELEFRTSDPVKEEGRRRFAHYLWNAGVLLGEVVGGRGVRLGGERDREWRGMEEGDKREGDERGRWWIREEEEGKRWSVKGERVLELGAGVGLAGIVSVLAGAEEVTISDYPAPEVLATLAENVSTNVSEHLRSRVDIEGHEWGDLSTPFALVNAGRYTRILAADCLWMPDEHHNLARSMLHFLSPADDARVFVMAGFHTGRAKLAPFFEEVVGQEGLEVEEIWEMDADGERREWVTEREGEGVAERKKWTVAARLKRKP